MRRARCASDRRRPGRRLELVLARGDLAAAQARALALGVFSDVRPGGAARALDAPLEGAIRGIWRRRLFAAGAGQVFVLPCAGRGLAAGLTVLAGLGAFDRLGDATLRLAAGNVARVLVAGGVDTAATVVWGAGSGRSASAGLRALVCGFVDGLRDADRRGRFRRLVVCEADPRRARVLAAELKRLASSAEMTGVEVTLGQARLPEPAATAEADPAYLLCSVVGAGPDPLRVRSALLSAGGKATVVSGTQEIPRKDWEGLVARARASAADEASLRSLGEDLARRLLAEEVRDLLATQPERHLVVVHDAVGSRVPWETLRIAGGRRTFAPALEGGLTRRCETEKLSVAKWLEQRRLGEALDVLLVVNPTLDLPGAEMEGARIAGLLEGEAGAALRVRVETLHGAQATRGALRERLRAGAHDVVHFAGHAFFDAADPGRSGILCAGREVLSGADLEDLPSLPALVFVNACESGRVRRPRAGRELRASTGVAEAFLRGGLASYLGTYWPVGDTAALAFAEVFYARVLEGRTLGEAVLAGRRGVRDLGSGDWADYMLYGGQDLRLR